MTTRHIHRRPRPITPLALLLLVFAAAGALFLLAAPAQAQPTAYDLQVAFDAPDTGGTPTGYRLYEGCDTPASKQLLAEFATTSTTQASAVTNGVHHFCVAAYNATGEGPLSEIARVEIGDAVPGQVRNLQISVPCDGACSVTVTVHPAP